MEFCPKCKKILTPKREEEIILMACKKCDYSVERNLNTAGVPLDHISILRKNEPKATTIPVIENEKPYTTEHYCSKCGNDRAYFRELKEDRFADEQYGALYTCSKCGSTERVY